jgi:transcriptional regulator with XRE-family HTH domain
MNAQMEVLMSKVCEEIRRWADKEGMSLQASLQELGLAVTVFYSWEKGSRPRPTSLHRIAARIGVAYEDLLDSRLPTIRPRAARADSDDTAFASDQDWIVGIPGNALNEIRGVLSRYGAWVIGPATRTAKQALSTLTISLQHSGVPA